MLLRSAIGSVLRMLRADRALTLREVSARANVSLPYLSEVERGRKEVSSELLERICAVLDVTVDAVLDDASAELRADRARRVAVLDLGARRARAEHLHAVATGSARSGVQLAA